MTSKSSFKKGATKCYANNYKWFLGIFSLLPSQVEELREIPDQAAKSIGDLQKKAEKLEKEKQKEDVKLKEVMDSLKTETQVCDTAYLMVVDSCTWKRYCNVIWGLSVYGPNFHRTLFDLLIGWYLLI